ncbi:MAG TPA: hypothetical protein VG897_09465 [Terriglobales bacterium]|nr:hypothetical protein [Terriglobales bacterium]
MSTTTQIREDDKAYLALVSNQVRRVTQELNKLEQMLQAGMVDRAVLTEFRQAVDQIRKTSWNVEHTMQRPGK